MIDTRVPDSIPYWAVDLVNGATRHTFYQLLAIGAIMAAIMAVIGAVAFFYLLREIRRNRSTGFQVIGHDAPHAKHPVQLQTPSHP